VAAGWNAARVHGRDPARRTGGRTNARWRRRWRRRRRLGALMARLARQWARRFADGEDLDPVGPLGLGRRGAIPGEMQVVAAAVARVAVVADPAEGRDGLVLNRLGPFGEAVYAGPGAVALGVPVQRHDVDGEPVVVVRAPDMAFVAANVFAVR